MVDNALLSKVLKEAVKGGKSAVGVKECVAAMKGSKAVLCARSIPPGLAAKLKQEAEKYGVPVLELPQTSSQLAALVGKPYRVSAVAVKGVGDADVKQLLR